MNGETVSNSATPTEITNTIRCCFNGIAIIDATTVLTGNTFKAEKKIVLSAKECATVSK